MVGELAVVVGVRSPEVGCSAIVPFVGTNDILGKWLDRSRLLKCDLKNKITVIVSYFYLTRMSYNFL